MTRPKAHHVTSNYRKKTHPPRRHCEIPNKCHDIVLHYEIKDLLQEVIDNTLNIDIIQNNKNILYTYSIENPTTEVAKTFFSKFCTLDKNGHYIVNVNPDYYILGNHHEIPDYNTINSDESSFFEDDNMNNHDSNNNSNNDTTQENPDSMLNSLYEHVNEDNKSTNNKKQNDIHKISMENNYEDDSINTVINESISKNTSANTILNEYSVDDIEIMQGFHEVFDRFKSIPGSVEMIIKTLRVLSAYSNYSLPAIFEGDPVDVSRRFAAVAAAAESVAATAATTATTTNTDITTETNTNTDVTTTTNTASSTTPTK